MATLVFSPEADDELTRLENDPGQDHLVARIHTALDVLEADPGDVRNRRRRFNTIGVWGIAIVAGDEEWLILWEPADGDDVVVHHIIPAP